MFSAVKIKVRIKLLTKSHMAAPKALLPKSEVFIRLFNKFCRNDAIVNIATKIIMPPNTSDNCRFEFNQLLMYAPISSEYRKLRETAIKSENR